MEKILVNRRLTSFSFDYEYVDDVIKRLQTLSEDYPGYSHFHFEKGYDDYSESESIFLCGKRLETDEEHQKRVVMESKRATNEVERRRRQYEALKKEFEAK